MSVIKLHKSDSGGGLPKESSAEKLPLDEVSAFSHDVADEIGLEGVEEIMKENITLAESRSGNAMFAKSDQDDEEEKKDPGI